MIMTAFALLAETRMAEISLQYREEVAAPTSNGIWYLLVPVVAVGLGLAIYKYWNREPAILNTPSGMLHELCRVHRLGQSGRVLLDRVVDEAGVEQPALVLAGLEQFNEAVERARKAINYTRKQESTLGMIRRKAFGTA